MPLYTNKLKLPYLAPNEPITSQFESTRYNIIDVQLAAFLSILGSGVIEGWNITTQRENNDGTIVNAPPNSIFISPGNGFINNLAAETTTWTTLTLSYIGTPEEPLTNYIYAGTTEQTPLTKNARFVIAASPLNHTDIIPLGNVVVSPTGLVINSSDKKDIGFLSKFLSLILDHRHGRDGVAPIDLSSDVKGFLSSENIGDIPAERITSGIINPQRFKIDHLDLLNGGENLSHNDLDSVVNMLQKTNKKLFGDITTANLMQLIIAAKQSIINVDRNFRNLLVIVPGIDNNTFANTKSFLDPEYTYEKNYYEEGKDSYILGDKEIFFKKDASIIDYTNGFIYGRIASGISIHEISIDNPIEFSRGEYDSSFIEIRSINSESDYGYLYGYGYGYGEGLDFFDVFGVASGITDINGIEQHIGYGTEEFELEFKSKYGYGYGTEFLQGKNPSLPGRAFVTLKQNPSDVKIYRFDHEYGDPKKESNSIDPSGNNWIDKIIDDDFDISENGTENIELINGNKVYNRILERCEYFKPSSSESGKVSAPAVKNRRLVYLINPNDPLDIDRSNWSTYNTLQFKIKPSEINAYGNWKLIVYSEKKVGVNYTTQASAPIPFINGSFSGLPNEEKIISVDISTIANSNINFNLNRITKIEIIDTNTIPVDYPNITIIPWSSEIIEIGLSGGFTFSKVDENNSIKKLYLAIPFNPAATLKNISWVCQEPSSSRILIYIKAVDATNSNIDGFQLLENISFGNPYTNKANLYPEDSITIARPSGSDITEGSATHIELKVVLQPSVDGNMAPILNAITLRYSVAGHDEEIIFDSDESFNIDTVLNTQRSNISLNSNSNLIINRISDVALRSFGLKNRFEQIKKINDSMNDYELITAINNEGNNCIRTIEDYLSNREASYNKISSIKKTSNGDLILCDTLNHRIVALQGTSNKFLWCISGVNAIENRAGKISPIFAHYNTNEQIIYIGFSKSLSDISSINNNILRGSYITDNDTSKSFTIGPNGDDVQVIYAANSVDNISNLIRIKLTQSTINKINSLKGEIALLLNGKAFDQSNDETFTLAIEKWNVYYAHISNPIDIKTDINDNIICAQSIPYLNSNNQLVKNEHFNSIIKFNLKSLDLYNPDNLLNKWNYSLYQNTPTFFNFDINYCGSVEEIVNEIGERELLIADFNNQRVLRIKADTSELIWQIDTNKKQSYSIPSDLYPTCATRGDNGLFYIALYNKDNSTGEDSQIIELTNDYQLLRTLFNGRIKTPQDIYYLEGNRLLISS